MAMILAAKMVQEQLCLAVADELILDDDSYGNVHYISTDGKRLMRLLRTRVNIYE